MIVTLQCPFAYPLSNLDEQEEDDDHKQVVNDADSSDDDVEDLHCEVTDVRQICLRIIWLQRGRCDVVPDIIRQRCVLHRCQKPRQSSIHSNRGIYSSRCSCTS